MSRVVEYWDLRLRMVSIENAVYSVLQLLREVPGSHSVEGTFPLSYMPSISNPEGVRVDRSLT